MTAARRLTDADGHLWPITGQRCPVCRMPADPVLDGEPHPFCLPQREVSAQEYAAALKVLVESLGGVAIRPRPFDRWLVSGAALPTPPSTPAADPIPAAIAAAPSDEALTAVWRRHVDRWTTVHTTAAKARLIEIGAR